MYKYIFLVIVGAFMVSCGNVETHTLKLTDVELFAEGPLFEGANMATADQDIDLAALISELEPGFKSVKSAKLKTVRLYMVDTLNFDFIDDISLLMASDNADMTQVALLNPVPNAQTSVDLNVGQDQKGLGDILNDSKITFVADMNINQDTFIDLRIKGDFEFDVQIVR